MNTYQIGDRIRIYRYGDPIETDSVVVKGKKADLAEDVKVRFEDGKSFFSLPLKNGDIVYGLGGNLGGINKRGKIYESYCTDEACHTEDKKSLYAAHNFFIISGESHLGYFVDFPTRVRHDVGFTHRDQYDVSISGKDFDLYVIEGESPKAIVSEFLKIIGQSYVPPKWGFGYFQSRWGYETKEEIRDVQETFKNHDIPLDGIYLDLDYMEDFKVFSTSDKKFEDLKSFTEEMKSEGIRLIPIIDAGVKIEDGYDIYEEGIKGDHFCKDTDGNPYVAAVWPGRVHFPDFAKEETQEWFGSKYKFLTDLGIEGVWNDMNEPAIFYDEKALKYAIDQATEARDQNLDIFSFFGLKDHFTGIQNKVEYYQSFYHDYKGKTVSNDEIHNLYGYLMTKSANMGLTDSLEKRFVLISRASSIGMHRYGGIWTGDNHSWWSHLKENIQMMPSLNMCGFYYTGADTGGFGSDSYGEMLTRWIQFSSFTPLLRNHSPIGTRYQEPYSFESCTLENTKNLIRKRYMLIPYLYSEYMKAVTCAEMMYKPLAFEYDDQRSKEVYDQLLLGNEMMLAPVHEANKTGRYVHLPETMIEVDFTGESVEAQVRGQGPQYLDYDLSQFKFYIRKNALIPYVQPSKNVEQIDMSKVNFVGYVSDKAVYDLYDDDGTSFDYKNGKAYSTRVEVVKTDSGYDIRTESNHPDIRKISLKLYDSEGQVVEKTVEI